MTRLTNWCVDADEAHPVIPYWPPRWPSTHSSGSLHRLGVRQGVAVCVCV